MRKMPKFPMKHSVIAVLPLLAGCSRVPAVLSSNSPSAARIELVWWIMFWLGTVIFVGVTALLLVGLFRRQRTPGIYAALPEKQRDRAVNLWVIGGGIVMPVLILVGMVALTVWALRAIPAQAPSDALVIEVTGHQWWWEVHYPDSGVTLQDEVRIPVGAPVQVRLTSADVIHSFWVPELHGKFDAIPGRIHEFVLQSNEAGEYRGQCAEFCGLLHARMIVFVVAMPPEEFNAWLDEQAVSAVVR